jgi:hypothetical protein
MGRTNVIDQIEFDLGAAQTLLAWLMPGAVGEHGETVFDRMMMVVKLAELVGSERRWQQSGIGR